MLPDHHARVLETIVVQIRNRAQVMHHWGFAERDRHGHGVCAVFAGPSGTGKTMAAEALANALELDLYRVDLSALVGDSPGQTETRIRRLFDGAEAGGAVLLFEQADAMFAEGSAEGLELGYLLRRLEEYPGVAVFTLNPRMSIDSTTLRRFGFFLDFPLPDMALREKLWRRMFPPEVPREDLVYYQLSRLSVSGRMIRDIVLTAAYLAADSGGPVTMAIMLEAAGLEYAKRNERLPAEDIEGWV